MVTNLVLDVSSYRLMQKIRVHKFVNYNVDIDMETDADMFDFTIKNPSGAVTGVFNKYDDVDVLLNNTGIMKGIIDDVEYSWDDNDSTIRIIGRDLCGKLIDNDSLPGTKLSVKPSSYIFNKCKEYGIGSSLDGCISAPTIEKLIIATGESEISIINNIAMDSRRRVWYIYDTLYAGFWDTNPDHTSYTFVRGNMSGIRIKSLKLTDSGVDTKSEILIYGSMDSGSEKVVGTARNTSMINRGIKRRSVKSSSNNDVTSRHSMNALRDIRDSFRNNIQLVITVSTGNKLIMPNTVARVIDNITKINSIFFIKGVTYRKDISTGSETIITMVPGDTTFEVLWDGQGSESNGSITGLPKMSLADLVKSRKG